MKIELIQALGYLLATYHLDLIYIRDFHKFKNKKISKEGYLSQSTGTFISFLNDFRVARNVDKTQKEQLLDLTTEWINGKYPNDVDKFAEFLKKKGITHDKIMTSLASKILFLNNPLEILPIDNLVKKAVKQKSNLYKDYFPLKYKLIAENEQEILKALQSIEKHLFTIESQFTNEIKKIEIIRYNRLIDKILWTVGRGK